MGFTAMFNLNQQTSMVLVESGPIQGAIWNAIVEVSAAAKVDPRLILAVVMQEVWHNLYPFGLMLIPHSLAAMCTSAARITVSRIAG
jgi:hypothetical protein